MKRTIIFLFLAILLTSLASAEIIITEQPEEIYNYGDIIEIPSKIVATENLEDSFQLNLICSGVEKIVHFENIQLSTGQEKTIKPIVLLNKNFVERPGTCVAKAILLNSETNAITTEFKVSDSISIELDDHKTETAPQKHITVEGNAIKENGENVQGKAILRIVKGNKTIIEKTDTVNNGYFFLNFSFPKDTASGQYLVELNVQEKDNQEIITNKGFVNYNILVTQVPTSLEILFDKRPVEPGTNLKVKTILHDQTGEPIEATSIITIKNSNNEIIEQSEKQTDSFLEFPILYNQPPEEWKIYAVSSKLSSEETFNISQKEDIEIFLVNRTVTITNTGNVPYCDKSTFIKIGNESIKIDVCLEVNEEQKYLLTAPDGEYEVNILTEGKNPVTGNVLLTGKAISVKETSKSGFLRYSILWAFVIAILGFVAYMFFKKGYKKSFFGYVTKKKNKNPKQTDNEKNSPLKISNKAELSLSIKGEKQNISLICLKIKNLKELISKSPSSSTTETLQKIISLSEESKASVYENGDNLFFLLAPVKTRTFKNEKTAIELAQKIKSIMSHHNKMMKDKMEYGISLNYGTIVGKVEPSERTLKFMSMGTLITTAKKIAGLSKEEILLSEKINERLRTEAKTEKETHGSTSVYRIKEMKNKEEHKKFLSNFVKRLEKDKNDSKKKS